MSHEAVYRKLLSVHTTSFTPFAVMSESSETQEPHQTLCHSDRPNNQPERMSWCLSAPRRRCHIYLSAMSVCVCVSERLVSVKPTTNFISLWSVCLLCALRMSPLFKDTVTCSTQKYWSVSHWNKNTCFLQTYVFPFQTKLNVWWVSVRPNFTSWSCQDMLQICNISKY